MVVKIFKTNSDVTKIEVHGHADNNIVCAGFSSLFHFLMFSLPSAELTDYQDPPLGSEEDGYPAYSNDYRNSTQIKTLEIYKGDECDHTIINNFEEYCILLKKQHKLNLEVINK